MTLFTKTISLAVITLVIGCATTVEPQFDLEPLDIPLDETRCTTEMITLDQQDCVMFA